MTRTSSLSRALFALATLLLVVGLTTRTPDVAAHGAAPQPALSSTDSDHTEDDGPGHIEFAPPADTLLRLTQPDGSTVGATLTPAHQGGALEVGGYSVAKDAEGWWRYVSGRDASGGVVLTSARAGVDERPADLAAGAARTPDAHALSSAEADLLRQLQMASHQASVQAAQDGGVREFRFPVVLFATWYDSDAGQSSPQFQEGNDVPHFTAILDGFGGNPTGSLTEFYFENSHGQFLVIVDVLAQPDGSPYVSNRSSFPGDEGRCYYGGIDPPPDLTDDLDPIDNVLGVGGGGALGMAVEVMNTTTLAADHDFSVYDNDGDGKVDFMGILHSGPEMAVTGNPCHTWSHAITVSTLANLPFTLLEELAGVPAPVDASGGLPVPGQTVTYDRLFTMPEFETPDGVLSIGVAAHEMAHALGEPDYYATDGSSPGTGNWDIMSGGSYGGTPSGSVPTWFNPASRVFQGWVTPTIVHTDQLDVVLEGRSHQPMPDYRVGTPNPNLILVPTRWVDVGETTEDPDRTWTENDVFGLPLDGDNGYVLEGWYLEYVDRMPVRADAIHPEMTRESYFDRWSYGSGLLTWHFDYWKRSNVYFGQNGGNNDPQRMQMDVEEWDYNDNTQEIALNQSRSESSDVASSAATGLTSGTHRPNPDVETAPAGDPQDDIAIQTPEPALLVTTSDAEFFVDDNPANRSMTVTINSDLGGDCTLQLLSGEPGQERDETGVVDSAFTGPEQAAITNPVPGRWVARVGDFAACGTASGTVSFRGGDAFDTTGTADTYSNFTQEPTGWAFTNIRTGAVEGLAHGADSATVENLTLDIVDLSDVADVSPGFAQAAPSDAKDGRGVVTAGAANAMAVDVFSNGGVSAGEVDVEVREGTVDGPVVASGTVDTTPYSSSLFTFEYTPAIEGGYDLFTIVDPAGAVDEGSEANNVQKSSGWAGPADPVVLLVDDDAVTDSEQMYAGSLAALGIPYAIASKHVTAEMMSDYEAVIWVGGLSRNEGQLDEQDRTNITTYLDDGGDLWLASNRGIETLTAGDHTDLLDAYFGVRSIGIESFYDPVQFETTDFFGGTTFAIDAMPGRPFLDEYEVTGAGESLGVLNGSGRAADGVAVLGARVDGDGFRTVTTAFGIRQVTDPAGAIEMVGAVMEYFEVDGDRYEVTTEDPIVYHSQPWQSQSGVDVPLRVIALGGEGAGQPVSGFYRRHGLGEFVSLELTATGDQGAYAGVIPGAQVTPDGIDYYLKAGSDSTYVPRLAETGEVTYAVAVYLPEGSATLPTPAAPRPTPAGPTGGSRLPATGGVPMLLAAGVLAGIGLLVRRRSSLR